MEKVTLSKRVMPVSRLAFGSLTLSPMQAATPVERAADIIAYAFERGISFIDTAQYYNNYHIIRRAFEKYGKPDDVVLSTKTYAYDKSTAMAALEEARRETGRDVIDIFMLHEQESYDTLRGHMEALDYFFECRERGIIRAVGASMHHVAAVKGVMRLASAWGVQLDVIHPIYNKSGTGIVDGSLSDMADAVREAHDAGVGVFGMKALAGGHLCSSAAEAFDFVLDSGFIDAVAVGMQSEAEVDANIEYFERRCFSPDAKERLAAKKRSLHVEEYCEGCGACVARCPVGALSLVENTPSAEEAGEFSRSYTHRAVCDSEKCVLCGYCSGVCPVFAVKVY
ncbi:MAG: aldo/keto reductase [Clostridia bacterium]|nr:aldo/keto reductase [Clostridia bacterium]